MAAHHFGLDIGRSFIKVAQTEVAGAKKVLTAAGISPTPAGGIQSESAVDLSKISESIKKCISGLGVETRRCVVSLSESQVFSRLIELPILTDKELAAAINWEAEQYIPLPIKDVSLEFQVVEKKEGEGGVGGKMKVLLVAAPKRVIEKYLAIVKGANLQVEALETESQALARALIGVDDPPTIIVSAGAISTELVVVKSQKVLFTRSIASGGASLSRAISLEFNLGQKQAEEYKQTYGLQEDKLSGKVAQVLKPILDIVVTEILKAVEFTKGNVGSAEVVRVVICGGGAFLPGLSEFLVERTSLEVSLGDPWADFDKSQGPAKTLAVGSSVYAIATGLAMRS